MKHDRPFGDPVPPEMVLVWLNSSDETAMASQFADRLAAVFRQLNWRFHLYLIPNGPTHPIEKTLQIMKAATDYLTRHKLATVYIHPFIPMSGFGAAEMTAWSRLLAPTEPFRQEAYDEHQVKERLIVLPILEPGKDMPADIIISAARFFQTHLAKPSFYFHGRLSFDALGSLGDDVRLYVDPDPRSSSTGVISQLKMNHIFEDILERLDDDECDVFAPCRRHLIIDEGDALVFSCFAQWENGISLGAIEQLNVCMGDSTENDCSDCISASCLKMGDNLAVNRRIGEGRQVCLRLAATLLKEKAYDEALHHAEKAFEFSASDNDRAMALLYQGMCHLERMRLDQADRAFAQGSGYAADIAIFSFHRGRIAFGRGNYDKAITRFHEALQAPSDDLPLTDVFFNLALCHVNMESFSQASFYLEEMDRRGAVTAPVRFYQGVCALAQGMAESALGQFQEAFALGPAAEDLSRVFFYIGTCLKELGRYDEAIVELRKAVVADPSEYLNYNLLGFCYFQMQHYEKAIEALHQAIKVNPLSAIDYASIGSNLRELGRFEDAIAMYGMALSIDPELSFAAENIAKLRRVVGEAG